MTVRSEGDAILSRIRWSGALAAVAALTALVVIGPPGDTRAVAAAGTGYDQITGVGSTDSAVTVSWKQGMLDNNNQPISSANAIRSSPTGPLAFMYQDPEFQNLTVKVSQTQDITHQGLTVTWSGAQQTQEPTGFPATDYLQLMECYGDSSSGPSPEGCEFGSSLIPGGEPNPSVGTRVGDLCPPGAVASTSNPPLSLNGDNSIWGCDPAEPQQGASPADIDPANPQSYTIPFVPAGGCDPQASGCPAYNSADLSQYFSRFSTNEVPEAVTNQDGTGAVQFETLTATQAPGLGCGQPESSGQTRNCWLVIVPRGSYDPNGFNHFIQSNPPAQSLLSSPLSASNWAMRIQIHLGYSPVQVFCPIGTQETETVGTQIAARAVQSWQLALNKAANCARIYGYSAVPEATSTQQLATWANPQQAGGGSGLAFTTIPIGSEAARPGASGGSADLPPILYAPVAVTAEGFGFNINFGITGYISTPVNLTPTLLAKSLTQVYRNDLPDVDVAQGFNGPTWAQNNPLNITRDQQFTQLNPGLPIVGGAAAPLAPLLTEDHSALNEQIWQWIQTGPAASAWLNQGTPQAGGDLANLVAGDPDYTALKLGTPPSIDSFPRAYAGCLDLGVFAGPPAKEEKKCSLDVLPYVNNYDEAASDAVTGNDRTAGAWDPQAVAPDGTPGWWDKTGIEPVGQMFVWAISDTPDLAAYGLIDAQLCSDSSTSSTNCVGPSAASLTTALGSAKADSAGLLQVNPASPGAGGYPLTQVVYAAVATSQPAANLSADADLIAYAAGGGQTPGVAPGDLPPGYLPLPTSLQAQAQAVVAQLRADASPAPSTSPSTTQTSGNGGSSSLTPSGGENAVSSATPAVGVSITPPHAVLAAQTTKPQPVGGVRWMLLAVVIAGAACAVGGTALRADGVARWLRRMRP